MDNIRRVLMCGASSTGKTTILNDVIGYLHDVADESNVGKKTVLDMGLNSSNLNPEQDPDSFERLQLEILARQRSIDEQHLEDNKDYISDRSIDPLVYADVYLGSDVGKRVRESPNGQYAIQRVKNAVVLVIAPHQEIITSDGIRLKTDMTTSKRFTEVLCRELERHDIKFYMISVLDRQERVKQVLDIIRNVYPEIIKS